MRRNEAPPYSGLLTRLEPVRSLTLVAFALVTATSALAQGFDGRAPQTRHPVPWGIGRPELVQRIGSPDFRPSLTIHGYDVGPGQAVFSFHYHSVESVAEIFDAPTRDLSFARSLYEAYKRAVGGHYRRSRVHREKLFTRMGGMIVPNSRSPVCGQGRAAPYRTTVRRRTSAASPATSRTTYTPGATRPAPSVAS